jgi:transposase
VLSVPRRVRILLATKPVDFRNGHHGLCGVVRNHLGGEPLDAVWVFHNRRRTALKILWWDHGGFVVAHKKLAKGRFRLPPHEGAQARMTAAELGALLEGIDLSRARRLPRWNPPNEAVKAVQRA